MEEQSSAAAANVGPATSPPDPWEAAYLRFETPAQEVKKFVKRLQRLGAAEWPRDSEIVELFCGRGNGLHALESLGFQRIEGVDLSPRLLEQYRGAAHCHAGDCRQLPFSDRSKDGVIVQGGLHHLLALPEDLDQALLQMQRVLRKNGTVLLVEPWLTPFLSCAHFACRRPLARRLSDKVDALATMIEYERRTYEQWLAQPYLILGTVLKYFVPVRQEIGWGKWSFVGHPRGAKGRARNNRLI
jgi:ubiquinone/menaquinone biosynthesis C-methylase UbiE